MARKRVIEAPSLKTWADVDAALREIAENELTLGDIQAEMNRQILGAKAIAEQESKSHGDRIAKLERDIKNFVEEHRSDLGDTKTRVLTFGEVGFRLSTSVTLPKAKEKLVDIIRKLKTRQMGDCIVVKEEVSKDALKKYGQDTVLAVGAGWKRKDSFSYEAYTSKLERAPSELTG